MSMSELRVCLKAKGVMFIWCVMCITITGLRFSDLGCSYNNAIICGGALHNGITSGFTPHSHTHVYLDFFYCTIAYPRDQPKLKAPTAYFYKPLQYVSIQNFNEIENQRCFLKLRFSHTEVCHCHHLWNAMHYIVVDNVMAVAMMMMMVDVLVLVLWGCTKNREICV